MGKNNKVEVIADLRLAKHIDDCRLDWRDISNGLQIPAEHYSDQPYIIKTNDNNWLCVHTTGNNEEGSTGQHIVSCRSKDNGKTWSELVDVESSDGPEASYAVLLKTNFGRIYCIYNYNSNNIRRVKADNPPYMDGFCYRVDSIGDFVFKYSDDNGKSWSHNRYNIPSREFEIDRNNTDKGKLRYFWNVGKPMIDCNTAYCSLHKVGGFGSGFFTSSEGVLLKSVNIMDEKDPKKIQWETLPEGDVGLRTPPNGGPIAEEQSYSLLSDGSFFCVYRSTEGHPVCSYSRDKGRTWETPRYMSYGGGRLMKNPRAANFAWKCENGKYLYWFHNHGGRDFEDRNPVWVCSGVEEKSLNRVVIKWSEPEILLYSDDPYIRVSYPDMVEDGGKLFISETQKNIPRVHEINSVFLDKLFSQNQLSEVALEGLLKQAETSELESGKMDFALACEFVERDFKRMDYGTKKLNNGFTLEFAFTADEIRYRINLLNNINTSGRGFRVFINDNSCIEIAMNDGRSECRWQSDPVIFSGKRHHVGIIVDGGPDIITFVIDGKLNDGGNHRQFGFGRFSGKLRNVEGRDSIIIGDDWCAMHGCRLYNRALMTSEVIGNRRAGFNAI